MNLSQLLIIFTIASGVFSDSKSTYTTKYDDVDLDEILANERLLTGYVNCLLGKGRCTPDGKELKAQLNCYHVTENLPDAIEDGCIKCSDKQKLGSERVMHYIIDHRPDDWAKLEEIYNPDGSYRNNYLKEELSQDKEEDEPENDKKDTNEGENCK
ncbi:Putative odorant-binding protein A10 [Eumeta japonica]|uniref:Odorant-binding protein A10 n=1 Tax=Eumeta variegata TaxID=151549 RepID=A0A4C1T002_EUMVA|nr:Putative odorant-binding protein A10 [Eumeta japonica]